MVADELKGARQIHFYSSIVNAIMLINLAFGYLLLPIIIVTISVGISAYNVWKINKLLKSPFLYLSEIERFCKDTSNK